MYSTTEIYVNTKTLPPLSRTTGSRPPKRRAALIRALLPEIEAAVASGQNLKDIWEVLQSEGLEV
jgi:hypothetical protein